MRSKQYFTSIKNNPHEISTDPLFCPRRIDYLYKIKKDTQEWKPPKCLISALLSFVAGPGIEPGTS